MGACNPRPLTGAVMNERFRFRTPIYGADRKFKKFVFGEAVSGFPAITAQKGDVFKEPEQCTGLKIL